jgi:hypothetical protein
MRQLCFETGKVTSNWQDAHLPDDVTGLLAAPVPGRAAFSAVVSAVRGLPLLPVPGRAELVLGLTKPVMGRPADDMGRMAGDAPPCGQVQDNEVRAEAGLESSCAGSALQRLDCTHAERASPG